MAGLRTEFPFTLPKGFVDGDGVVHRDGTMRLATARDELDPLNDPKVRDADDPYLTVIVLSRVITQLGRLTRLSPRDIEGLFAADLAYLQDVYGTVNYGTEAQISSLLAEVQQQRSGGAPPSPAVSPPSAAFGTPVSDAARSLLTGTTGPPHAGMPAGDDDGDEDDGGLPVPSRAPRRGRIEEVGRSSGRPSGL